MGAIDSLKKLIVDDAVVSLTQEYGKNKCVLTESQSDYSFTIHSLPDDVLIVKCDKFPTTKEVFFKSENMECKISDYVLVSESKQVIMFFELKRSNRSSSAKEIAAQLKGGKCVMDYCESIIDSFLGEREIFCGFRRKYYKGISMPSKKRPFRRNENLDNTTPENARMLLGSAVNFSYL